MHFVLFSTTLSALPPVGKTVKPSHERRSVERYNTHDPSLPALISGVDDEAAALLAQADLVQLAQSAQDYSYEANVHPAAQAQEGEGHQAAALEEIDESEETTSDREAY